jgi:hypothetical protein
VECDCTPRRLTPLETAACSECGDLVDLVGADLVMHTMSEPGDVMTVMVGCGCGGEVSLRCAVGLV